MVKKMFLYSLVMVWFLLHSSSAQAVYYETQGLIDLSYPKLADINGDGKQEILIGDNEGNLHAFRFNGTTITKMWQYRHNTIFSPINCATPVYDIDNDGALEIIVATGRWGDGQPDGVVYCLRVDENGMNPYRVWQFIVPHNPDVNVNYSGVVSSPVIVDLDQDGTMEIVFGSYDQFIFALNHDGSNFWNLQLPCPDLQPEYADSRFRTGFFVGDTIRSSAAVADIDKDGYPEIIIGMDTHNYSGWLLPFDMVDGGGVIILNHDGTMHPDFYIENWVPDGLPCGGDDPAFILKLQLGQTIWSSPALADLDGDGWLDILCGTGDYYTAPHEQYMYVWKHDGSVLWQGNIGDNTNSSPVVAHLKNDTGLEVMIGSKNDRIYAFEAESIGFGQYVSGWPVLLSPNPPHPGSTVMSSAIVADFDGDNDREVIIPASSSICVVEKNGTYTIPYIYDNVIYNSCAIGDLDGDGLSELVTGTSNSILTKGRVYVDNLNGLANNIDWPMFRFDVRNTAHYDTFAPGPITDLAVEHVMTEDKNDPITVELTWTAPGDDGNYFDRAGAYDIRYSFEPITPANFPFATAVSFSDRPAMPGSIEECEVHNLLQDVMYYFAIMVYDDNHNSSLSNNASLFINLLPSLTFWGLVILLISQGVVIWLYGRPHQSWR